ncbi:hypothetical protein RYH73_08770 [Olivibacter sp. CPCC 100613]|uniref:hypothetical protein n=1 Tax=Olivibacter sp. CPCC 100613 TaxID=3079931 RepID=UPI002FFD0FAA
MFGCHQEKMPAIYADQHTEVYLGDTNSMKKSYLQALNLAKSTGLAVRALTDEEFKKIGIRRNQLLITSDTIGEREESWGFSFQGPASNPGQCIFSLTYSGTLSIRTPKRSVKYNLENKEVMNEEADIPEAFSLHFKALPTKPSAEEEESMPAGIKLTGNGMLFQQPYVEWTYTDSTIERLWSKGREWGFSELPSGKNHATIGALVLGFEKRVGPQRLIMKTEKLSIGKKVCRSAFRINQAENK